MDWNLIPTLEALLSERSVSRAARRLGLSQPAVSNALARLRRQFDDELLIRRGSTYVLTPLAEQLATSTRAVVEAVSAVSSASTEFDPTSSTRVFTLAASDYAQTMVGPRLLRGIRQGAPYAAVAFVSPFGEQFHRADDILEKTDGWLAPREVLTGRGHIGRVQDRWVCVVDRDHPSIGPEMTLEDAGRFGWVAPAIRGVPLRLHVDALTSRGIVPRIQVSTESFGAVPFLVSGTQWIGIVQESLARQHASAAYVRVVECPWEAQPLSLTFWWSTKQEGDPGHAWLREVVRECLADVGAAPI